MSRTTFFFKLIFPHLVELQALAPLIEGDVVIVIRVAGVEERRNAVLQGVEGSANGEELMTGHDPVGNEEQSFRWIISKQLLQILSFSGEAF